MSNRIDLLIFEDAQEMKERREKEAKSREKKLAQIEKNGYCESFRYKCDNKKDVEWMPAATHYYWDVDEDPLNDPNRPIFLCPRCAEEYNTSWQERWDEYYAGLL